MLYHLHLFSKQLDLDDFLRVFNGLLISQEVEGLLLEFLGSDGLLIVEIGPLVRGDLLLDLKVRLDLSKEVVEAVTQLVVLLIIDRREQVRVGLLNLVEGEGGISSLRGFVIVEEEVSGLLVF